MAGALYDAAPPASAAPRRGAAIAVPARGTGQAAAYLTAAERNSIKNYASAAVRKTTFANGRLEIESGPGNDTITLTRNTAGAISRMSSLAT